MTNPELAPDMPELLPCPEFEKWFYTARSPEKDMPWGTHLIYQVCDNDPKRFELACEIMQRAFMAGMGTRTDLAPQAGSVDVEGLKREVCAMTTTQKISAAGRVE